MNVKEGDLAIIVRDPHSENLSLIVEVGPFMSCPCGAPAWICTSKGRPITVLKAGGLGVKSYAARLHDADLRPISGLPDTDDVADEHPLNIDAVVV